jgi:ubiquinone/menaquinone biosynthesis C-methylase UbiE
VTSQDHTEESRRYQARRIAHWNSVAQRRDSIRSLGGYYHSKLGEVYRWLIPPGVRVLEVGCAEGELLATVRPSEGVGIDFSPEMVSRGRKRFPHLDFVLSDAHDLDLGERTFDYIVLSDLINDVWDVQRIFERLKPHTHAGTRLVINSFSHLWEFPLRGARRLGLATPVQEQNWLTVEDINGLLSLAGFETVKEWEEMVWPARTPLLADWLNRYLPKIWPARALALSHFIVARPRPPTEDGRAAPRAVSVIVAARNEAGHMADLFRRIPEMGSGTEVIFVEGGSEDDTYATIEREIQARPGMRYKLLKQSGKGKGDAVRLGFANATGDVLMILDADITVLPEDLPRFYAALVEGRGEFINGVRLVYPMEDEAMRFLNLLGNKFFSRAFSWLLGQPVKDTLCGTKVLWRHDYEVIVANRSYFGEFDPFGDFDLLFGAAKQNRKIVDMPIRYHARTYGETNIRRWKHGWLLIRMVIFAARKIKFF